MEKTLTCLLLISMDPCGLKQINWIDWLHKTVLF